MENLRKKMASAGLALLAGTACVTPRFHVERLAGDAHVYLEGWRDLRGSGSRRVLYLQGRIDRKALEKFTSYDLPGIDLLVLDSEGGVTRQAYAIADAVHDRSIDTHVPDGASCASACTIIYQAGKRRTAGPRAQFHYHTPVSFDTGKGTTFWSVELLVYYLNQGMSPGLVEQIDHEGISFSARRLAAGGYNVVQRIVEGLPGAYQGSPQITEGKK